MKAQLVKNKLVRDSDVLKKWKEGQAIIYNTCFNHKIAREQFHDLKEKTYSPQNFDEKLWLGAKLIAKVLKSNGVKCQVLRGNGTTSPAGSNNATNYFVVSKNEYGAGTNTLYLSFDMTEQNAKEIVAILEKYYIAFTWTGDLGSCFTFTIDREGYPE